MVGWFGVPSWAIAVGSPATLLTTTTATAPAACALLIFMENVQAPRERTAIIPARLLAGSELQAVPSPPTEPVTTPRGAVRSALTVVKSPDANPIVVALKLNGAPTKCGTVDAPAVNARAAEPGDPTV